MSEVPLYTGSPSTLPWSWGHVGVGLLEMQGYLAHKEPPTSLGPA